MACPRAAHRSNRVCICSQLSGVVPVAAAIRLLDEAFAAAGVVQASSHSLRRTHANITRRASADLKVIQGHLGHSRLAVTETKLSVDPREKTRAVSRLVF